MTCWKALAVAYNGPRPIPPSLRQGGSTPSPAGPRVPRGVHPETWRLRHALLRAREARPYASADARLLDGVERYVRFECTSPAGGVSLAPVGPRWAAVLALVAATVRLLRDPAPDLEEWSRVAGTPAPGYGVAPSADAVAAFVGGEA